MSLTEAFKSVLFPNMKKRTGFQVATLKSPPPQAKQEEKKTPTKAPSGSSSSSSSGSSSSSSETTARVTKECRGEEVTSVPRPPAADSATNQTVETSKCSTPADTATEGVDEKAKAKSPAASSSSSGSSTTNGKETKADTGVEVQSEQKGLAKAEPVETADVTTPIPGEGNDKGDSKDNNEAKSLLEVNAAFNSLVVMTSKPEDDGSVRSQAGAQSQSKKGVAYFPSEKAHTDKEAKIADGLPSDGPKLPDQSPKAEGNDVVKSTGDAAAPAGEGQSIMLYRYLQPQATHMLVQRVSCWFVLAEAEVAGSVKGSDADAQKCYDSAEPTKRGEVANKDADASDKDADNADEAKSSAKKSTKKGSSSSKSQKGQGDSKPPRAPTPYILFSYVPTISSSWLNPFSPYRPV
ncbi:hypothetical protein CLOM_g5424 [Closterium sp. NIES-68]|nr:hypothetical protein CLOM_g5424 [Closterium sp. NIES-68]GJP78625.1 hypothetical protein CLOP_g8902 [Closterium sp. NIES-67]